MKFVKQCLGMLIMSAWLITGPILLGDGIFFTFLSVLNPHPCYWEMIVGAMIALTALTYVVGNYPIPGMED